MLNYIKSYFYWRKKHKGIKTIDHIRGVGYYITTGLLFSNPKGQIWESEMKSGKIGIYELVNYETFRDPSDMIKASSWNFIGYKNVTPIKECSFKEFRKFYC